jgi:hypothetical protein
MSPILGIMASAISGNLTPTTGFVSIATTTLSSTQATIDFTSIPSTYKHLQIRYIARNSAANTDGYQAIQFNGDSTNGNYYFYHFLEGVGTGISAAAGGTNAGILAGRNSGASATSGVFGAGIIDILDYTNTNKNKVVRVLAGSDNNGSGNVLDLSSGFWLNTAAVTSIKLLAGLGGYSFVSGTTFALYGIQG